MKAQNIDLEIALKVYAAVLPVKNWKQMNEILPELKKQFDISTSTSHFSFVITTGDQTSVQVIFLSDIRNAKPDDDSILVLNRHIKHMGKWRFDVGGLEK